MTDEYKVHALIPGSGACSGRMPPSEGPRLRQALDCSGAYGAPHLFDASAGGR
jgi:hypothetical protein